MTGIEYVLLPFIALAAYVLKAMTGFGPAIIFISFGALLVPPHAIIATSAILDVIAGLILLRVDWKRGGHRYWLPLAGAIVAGSIIGACCLKLIPAELFERLLGGAICILGLWFIFGRSRSDGPQLQGTLPERCTRPDKVYTSIGGFFGGLLGISGPFIIWHFGRQFEKRVFRQILVPVFAIAALSRSMMYTGLGFVDLRVLGYAAVSLPGLLAGIYVGNKIFFTLSETLFSRIVGCVLLVVSIRILL